MKVAVYSCHTFEKKYIEAANTEDYELVWSEDTLNDDTIDLAKDCKVITVFSSDKIDSKMAQKLKDLGVRFIATRSAGTDHIDLEAAEKCDLKIANVPEYSPNAIAEHCIALTLALYRKLKPSFHRMGNYNFSLEGQVGQEIHLKTVGICGTGDIGEVLAALFHCFGARVLLFDAKKNANLKKKSWANYVDKETLLKNSDIISLNLPLNEKTSGFISRKDLKVMKNSAVLINTGRGGLVNTEHVFDALNDKIISGFAMDVYENEKGIFYQNLSKSKKKDDLLTSLIEMENVVVTAHQAFLTDTALSNMMETVFENIGNFVDGKKISNLVSE